MSLEAKLFVFLLSTFLGLEVIRRVSPLLHTPLMSLTNAISAIAVVAAIQVTPKGTRHLSTVLGTLAVIAATTNIVGGFWITDRMLKMFRRETHDVTNALATLRVCWPPWTRRRIGDADRASAGPRTWWRPRCSSCRSSGSAIRGRPAAACGPAKSAWPLAIVGTLMMYHVIDVQMGARRDRARLADRRADGHLDADDGRAAADGAVARLRRAGRRAGGHRPLLRLHARNDRPLHDGRSGARSAAGQPHVHRQPRGLRQTAGADPQLDQRPAAIRTRSTSRCSAPRCSSASG